MSDAQCHATLVWSGAAQGPTDTDAYSREFRVEIAGKVPLRGSADPSYRGDPALHSPEDLLLSALASCHMLSYLAVCAHSGVTVASYRDEAIGSFGRSEGKIKFTDVLLKPTVVVAAGSDVEKAKRLHDKAHHICIVANSVNFPVRYEPGVSAA